jgi:hypothetical protein
VLDDTLVARALSKHGLSFGDPDARTPYLLHQYPGDRARSGMPTAAALDMGKRQSGCLLHCRGVLAADEVDGVTTWDGKQRDVLRESYASPAFLGRVEAMLQKLARARGLLLEQLYAGTDLPDLEPADIVVMGLGGSLPTEEPARSEHLRTWGGIAHGFVVIGRDGYLVESSDGGQTDAANAGRPTLIRRRERRLERRGNGWWLVSAGDARRLNWRLRAGHLPLRRS